MGTRTDHLDKTAGVSHGGDRIGGAARNGLAGEHVLIKQQLADNF